MADFKLSSYQQDILDYFNENPSSNILVNALAGAAKTTTITLLTEHTKTSDAYLAFNSSIAEEFKQKIKNPKTKVYTTHALAFLIMNTNLSNSTKKGGFGKQTTGSSKDGAKLDNLKPYKILNDLIPKYFGKTDFEYRQFLSSNFVSLYNLARVTMTDISVNEEIIKLVDDYNIFVSVGENNFSRPNDKNICSLLRDMDNEDWKQFHKDKVIDFTDMLYITYWELKNKEWEVPYWLLFTNIYVDECLPGYVNVQCLEFDIDNRPHESHYQMEKLYKRFEAGAKLPMALSLNEYTKRYEYKQITKVKKIGIRKTWGIRTISADGSKTQDLRSTDNHPILIYRGEGIYEWVEMKQVQVGNKVVIGPESLGEEVQYEEVIKKFPGKVEKVYDITVVDNHNFVCRSDIHDHGFTVHNCQDQNNLQLNLIKFIKRDKGRYVFCGDSHQSCYNFSGSNAYSFNMIPKLFAPMTEFDLPICYRCPTSHLEQVNKTFNIPILPRPNAPTGKIRTINKNQIVKYIQPGDMVISRKNKWLPDVIFGLVSNGISVYMEDKEFVNAIKKLVDTKKYRTVIALKNGLERTINSGSTSIKKNKKNKDTKIENKLNLNLESNSGQVTQGAIQVEEDLNSQLDNLIFLKGICNYYIDNYNPQNSTTNFLKYLDRLLKTEPDDESVRVTSVHKAKGLEADNVFVLNEAKVCFNPMNSKEQNIQERNLSYISITRAKENLYLVREDS